MSIINPSSSQDSQEKSKTRIISNAFVLLGKLPINQIDITNPSLKGVSDIYDIMVRNMLCEHPWNFAKISVDLQRTTETPNNEYEWKYIYKIPSIPEVLVIRGVYPNSDYDIYINRIYSNQESLKVTYTYKVRENDFPSYFELSITYAMCSSIGLSVTQDPNISTTWEKRAEMQLIRAKQLDSFQVPSIQIDPYNDIYASFFT